MSVNSRELTSADRDKIDDIMDNFDFQKVADYMRSTDWTWYDHDKSKLNGEIVYYLPDVSDLRRKARDLLKYVLSMQTDTGYYFSSSGGFQVFRYPVGIQLLFSIAGYHSEDDDEDE